MAFVYILQCNDFFKLGYTSTTVNRRISSLMVGNPYPITIIAEIPFKNTQLAKNFEGKLHKDFLSKKERGEWFKLDSSDIDKILSKFKGMALIHPINKYDSLDRANDEVEFWKKRYAIIYNKTNKYRDKAEKELTSKHNRIVELERAILWGGEDDIEAIKKEINKRINNKHYEKNIRKSQF